jgi:hypothetical protein
MEKFNAAMQLPKIKLLVGRAQEHIDKQLQRFWELKEMFPSSNRLAAEETACEQHFIDSNHRNKHGRYTGTMGHEKKM